MIGGKSVLELAVVTAGALGFVTLLVVVQAKSRGRTRAEILRACGLVWGAVALTLGVAWLLDAWTGGGLFDVQLGGGARVVTGSLGRGRTAVVVALLAVLIGLYVAAITAVRRLLAPDPALTVGAGDEPGGEAQ